VYKLYSSKLHYGERVGYLSQHSVKQL